VTGADVPNDEMPNILRPGRRDPFPLTDTALAALLAGTEPPAEPAPGLQPVADVLAALRASPTSDELAGEARALAEFRRAAGVPALPRRPRHRRPRVLPSWAGGKAAAGMGIAALSIGGLAVAAFAGVLPAPVQRIAHEAVHAPAAPAAPPGAYRSRPGPQAHHAARKIQASPTPADPAAGAPAVRGPCAAYLWAWAHGSLMQRVIALHDVTRAAGGAGEVTAYCGRTRPLPGWPGPPPPHHTGNWIPPSWRDRRFPHHRDSHGIPPGEQRAQRGSHQNDKPRAHRTGKRGQHPPSATGRDAHIDPHATELFPRSQLGRVGPRHSSEG
jgi:hypothetical protein